MQTATTTLANQAVARTQGGNAHAESLNMRKRIGSTVYEVRIHFNQDAKETMNDKLLRLIRSEAISVKAAGL